MIQKRDAPAYQEYPASMMAKIEYRTMSLQDRGLLYSMRHECWVNTKLPKNISVLAKVLGFDIAEIAASLPVVMHFFEISGDHIFSPELENYRHHLTDQRERMAAGGKKSSEEKKKKLLNKQADDKANLLLSTLQAPSEAPYKVLVQSSTEKQSQEQYEEKEFLTIESEEYSRASDGF